MKKFELTNETIEYFGHTLYRIRALVEIERYHISPGDPGGWIEAEDNLSQIGNAWVSGNARVYDNAQVFGNARVSDNALVSDDACIKKDACITSTTDFLVVGPIGSRNDFTTFYRCIDDSVKISCGCFIGGYDEFLDAVNKTHGDSKHASDYRSAVAFAKSVLKW